MTVAMPYRADGTTADGTTGPKPFGPLAGKVEMTGTSSAISQFGPHFVPALPTEIPPFVDIDMVQADVADDGVSTPNPGDVAALRQIVEDAAADGINLKVVVVEANPFIIDTPLRDVATAVGQANPESTVLVLSPNFVGTYSKQFSRTALEEGQDVAKTGNPVLSAENFVSTLRVPEFPWTALTIVLVLATAGAAIVTRLLQLRSKNDVSTPGASDQAEANS
jgi:hypothetical protein